MLLSQDSGLAHGSRVQIPPAAHSVSLDDSHGPAVESSTESIPVHPLGVKPLGNQFFASAPSARQAIGSFGSLPDEMILQLLEYLGKESLRSLGSTSRFLYAFCQLDELWKPLFLEAPTGDAGLLPWKGSWRSTVLQLPKESAPKLDCSNVFSDVLHRPFACSHIVLKNYVSGIPRANQMKRLSSLSHEDFLNHWSEKPFILTDYIKQWPVFRDWTIAKLNKAYANVEFRAEAVDWPFSMYHTYMQNSDDESPLYLFDRKFAEKMSIKVGQEDGGAYWPPECFGEDVFHLLGQERPAHRWLIVGPERSGSTFHKDPNATSAWNAVLEGSKYWLMFPPSVPQPPGVFVSEDSSEVTSPLSIAEYLLTFHAEAREEAGCIEGICRAGELLYVPSGWWHLVINLEAGIALTQNFVTNSKKHLAHVLSFLKDKPDQVTGFSRDITSPYELFVERLREKQPDLLEVALEEMDRRNGGKKRRWEEAVGAKEEAQSEAGGFSFGFGGDDLDDEEIP
ncbi:hypothetical protein JX265_013778 [Neoarthrinium moseri]|uniref:Uncharacterized protein n=1 Tax=Neoarthrinium moseri TaxID=1658444 RepID=A0A9P9W8B7_9PEZI|nr:uncharacterized protein JN550_010333 [Neoarthrinium moseri]KAI1848530.1 hypothetical protein JX265_013778 [Neoarthrinium moseri]KAI1862326.1 hypothetical protein JN550_010333 [Neoarthrinium moseri]